MMSGLTLPISLLNKYFKSACHCYSSHVHIHKHIPHRTSWNQFLTGIYLIHSLPCSWTFISSFYFSSFMSRSAFLQRAKYTQKLKANNVLIFLIYQYWVCIMLTFANFGGAGVYPSRQIPSLHTSKCTKSTMVYPFLIYRRIFHMSIFQYLILFLCQKLGTCWKSNFKNKEN